MHVLDDQVGFSLSSTIVFFYGRDELPLFVCFFNVKTKTSVCRGDILVGFYRGQKE